MDTSNIQDDSEAGSILPASAFTFSGAAMDQLTNGSSKYTLATIVVDVSSSVFSFKDTIEALLAEIVEACKKDPAADTLMVRVVTFNHNVSELHGFKLLGTVNVGDYKGKIWPAGSTHLFDAMASSLEAAERYGEQLLKQAYMSNAVTFVITDGMDSGTGLTGPNEVKALTLRIRKNELLESSMTILLGLTDDPKLTTYLAEAEKNCGFDKSMVIGTFSVGGPSVNKGKLAKLAGFVAHSVSTTAAALGTGGPSKSIAQTLSI